MCTCTRIYSPRLSMWRALNVRGSGEQKKESQSPFTGRWCSTNQPPRAHSDITIVSFLFKCLFVCLFSTSSLHFHSTKSPSGTQAEVHEIKGIFTLKNILVIIYDTYRRHTQQNIKELYLLSFTPTGNMFCLNRWHHVSPSQIWHKIFSLTHGPLKVLCVKID